MAQPSNPMPTPRQSGFGESEAEQRTRARLYQFQKANEAAAKIAKVAQPYKSTLKEQLWSGPNSVADMGAGAMGMMGFEPFGPTTPSGYETNFNPKTIPQYSTDLTSEAASSILGSIEGPAKFPKGFYSHLERVLEASPQEKYKDAYQFVDYLRKQGVKPAELQHSGLLEALTGDSEKASQLIADSAKAGATKVHKIPWLPDIVESVYPEQAAKGSTHYETLLRGMLKGKATKSDALAMLAERPDQIEAKVFANQDESKPALMALRNQLTNLQQQFEAGTIATKEYREAFSSIAGKIKEVENALPKYQAYALEGPTRRYKETLLKLKKPLPLTPRMAKRVDELKAIITKHRNSERRLDYLSAVLNGAYPRSLPTPGSPEWWTMQNEWSDLHTRLSSTEEEAKHWLTQVELKEIERSRNFPSPHWTGEDNTLGHTRSNLRKVKDVKTSDEYEALKNRYTDLEDILDKKYPPSDSSTAYTRDPLYKEMIGLPDRMADARPRLEQASHLEELQSDLFNANKKSGGLDRFPFANSGHNELLIKQHILDSVADPDNKVITMTTGKQQAERYNSLVDELRWHRNQNGTYSYNAYKDGASIGYQDQIRPEELESHLGEAAKQIRNSDNPIEGVLRGDNLLVSGQEKITSYDIINKKALEKWTGEKASMSKTLNDDEVHSVKITDKLREKVKNGFPLYAVPALMSAHATMQKRKPPKQAKD
jgi:hypothetical protein